MVVAGVIAAAAFFLLVLHWWSEGIFDTSEALLLDTVFCGLIFGLFVARTPLQFAITCAVLIAAGAYAIRAYTMGGMAAYLKSQCEIYMEAIASDPLNLAAREHLADTLYTMGELDRAVNEMQAAVGLGAGIESQYALSRWQLEQRVRDSASPVCKWCGTESALGTRTCPRCGASLPGRSALARWIKGGRWATARLWLLIMAGLALTCVSLAVMPMEYAFIPLFLLGIALGGWVLIGSARA